MAGEVADIPPRAISSCACSSSAAFIEAEKRDELVLDFHNQMHVRVLLVGVSWATLRDRGARSSQGTSRSAFLPGKHLSTVVALLRRAAARRVSQRSSTLHGTWNESAVEGMNNTFGSIETSASASPAFCSVVHREETPVNRLRIVATRRSFYRCD